MKFSYLEYKFFEAKASIKKLSKTRESKRTKEQQESLRCAKFCEQFYLKLMIEY